MKNMTVRGIDPSLSEKLHEAAKQAGKSVNTVVNESLKQYFGLAKEKKFTKVFSDMDHLFGRWGQETFDRVQGRIDAGRRIDEELWK